MQFVRTHAPKTIAYTLVILGAVFVYAFAAQTVHAQGISSFLGFDLASDFFGWIFGFTTNAILSFFGLLLWVAAVAFQQAMVLAVAEMSQLAPTTVIEDVWMVLRDIGNIVLIFAFLAIGIGTILGTAEYGIRKLLPKLIIVALLINFSLFFTQVFIDVTNLLSLTIYQQMGAPECANVQGVWDLDCAGDNGVSERIIDGLRLTTIYDASQGGSLTSVFGAYSWETGLAALVGIIVVIIAAFVLFAAAILLIIRFVVLIFLMILSPLAFAALVLPKTKKYWDEWFGTLLSQALFAPALFLLLWIALAIIDSPVLYDDSQNFASAIWGDQGAVGIFISYTIVISLLVFALVAAKRIGAHGSSIAMKLGGAASFGAVGFAGRNTLGRAASRLAQSERLRNVAARGGIAGDLAEGTRRTLRAGAGATYDIRGVQAAQDVAKAQGVELGKAGGRGGYDAQLERQVKQREETAKAVAETRKTSSERSREEQLRTDIEQAKSQVSLAEQRVRTAANEEDRAAAKTQLGDAREYHRQREIALQNLTSGIKQRGAERKEQYATALATQKRWTPWRKVPRKNKEAADKIRKGKKTAIELVNDLLEETGEKKGEKKPEGENEPK